MPLPSLDALPAANILRLLAARYRAAANACTDPGEAELLHRSGAELDALASRLPRLSSSAPAAGGERPSPIEEGP